MDKMNVVLISDASEMQGRLIESELADFFAQEALTVYRCEQEEIGYCIGCFSCRYKTPGKCIYNDKMQDIIKSMISADMIILLSKMTFGCYSSAIKRVLDRTIPFETPFLRTCYGETHLTPRYPKDRVLTAVAYNVGIEPEEAVVFSRLTRRNAINFDAKWRKPVFFREGEDISRKLKRVYGDLLK